MSRPLLASVACVIALSACSADELGESATSDSSPSAVTMPTTVSADASSTTTAGSVEASTATTAATPVSTAPGGGVEVPATTAATVPASGDTVPPVVTDPAVVPAAPSDNCPVVPVASVAAELLITDDAVLYGGAPAPPCLRVFENQFVSLLNNAEADATIDIGLTSADLFAGDRLDSDPVITYAEVGETFDVYVAELDTVVTVQVLPIE